MLCTLLGKQFDLIAPMDCYQALCEHFFSIKFDLYLRVVWVGCSCSPSNILMKKLIPD
ncbi:hypothetical protein Plhal304r1_c033g0104551 [Plasmopara halstedii]